MTDRRTYLAGVGTVLATATAGCGFLLGDEPAEFDASPSAVPEATLQETGYEFDENEEMEVERELSAGGESRTVLVTNIKAKHRKAVSLTELGEQEAAVFTSLTTPQVEILGETFNPVEDMSASELAEMVQDQYEQFEDVEKQGESDVTIDGETTTQAKFAAEAVYDGSPLTISLHVTEAVELGEDFLVTFGAYPQQIPGEEDNVLQLMESVEAA